MKRKKPCSLFRRPLCAALGLALLLGTPALAEEAYYVENEWNYVDESMDISGGLPKDAAGVLGGIQRSGVLKVAIQTNQVPFAFEDPEKSGQEAYVGADMELARLIAERMGVHLTLKKMDATDVLPAVMEGQCDLAISGLSYTPARAIFYTMSKSYYQEGAPQFGLLLKEENRDSISSLEDLSGKVIVAQRNSISETLVSDLVSDYAEFWRCSAPLRVFEAVEQEKAFAGFVDKHSYELYMQKIPDCGLVLVEGLDLIPDKQYLGNRVVAKKGETQLVYFVNAVIDEVTENGLYEQWAEQALERAEELGL